MQTEPSPAEFASTRETVSRLRSEIGRHIVGQDLLVTRLILGLIANGHVLVEGVPGLAKTMTVHVLARALGAGFARIQFTPDLLPADLLGTQIYHPEEHSFHVRKGPVFANLILADEINRAPAKVQSGLLEAMQERQVSIGGETFPLPNPFLVMATQNPVELEGTYPLPEAQVDRFMMKVVVRYPSREEEALIVERMARPSVRLEIRQVASLDDILRAREQVEKVHLSPALMQYILDLVFATRLDAAGLSSRQSPAFLEDLRPLIQFGGSPRATLYLALAARTHALLAGRSWAEPEDVKAIAPDVLRHRIIPSYEAEAEGLDSDGLIARILASVALP